ncbi:MAG: PAS domain-containing protein [Deltaproteobacteria bacterium]|nr:PAS domain-containing protein [Deltaproteobacteria bacterium]
MKEELHRLLKRQLKRHDLDLEALPEKCRSLINDVNDAYRQGDEDRLMLERALDLSSQELMQANSDMRAVLQALPDAFFRFDYEGIILDFKSLSYHSYIPPQPIQGRSVVEVFPPHIARIYTDAIAEADMSESVLTVEYSIDDWKGAHYYEARFAPVLEHQVIALVRDISERRQVEESVRRSEARFRALFESVQDGIFIKDVDFRYVLINPAMEKLFGKPMNQVIGRSYVGLFGEKDGDQIREADQKVLTGAIFESDDVRLDINDKRTFHVIKTPLVGGDGKVFGICGVARDTTKLKRMEEQIYQSQKMEALGGLAGGIAHDFNNLLMGIQGLASLMRLDLDPDHPHREKLDGIESQVMSGARLTRQLIGFAKGGMFEVNSTNLNELVERSSDMFGRTKKEVIIHKDLEKPLWTVEADRYQMEQVLLNLYINAWEAMPRGGELFISTENEEFGDDDSNRHFELPSGKYVKIGVRDTGIGMDKATQNRIFEPFFTTKSKGQGLGLASVYGIVKKHGGVITVYSEEGKGSAFTIYLPASCREASAGVKEKSELLRGTETVLIVDDEELILDVAARMLSALGYRVHAFCGGKEALAFFEENVKAVDLVILDMIMPGMSGAELFDRLRKVNPLIKVLLSSGYSIDGEARELFHRGCGGFIQKPYTYQNLSRKVRDILADDPR